MLPEMFEDPVALYKSLGCKTPLLNFPTPSPDLPLHTPTVSTRPFAHLVGFLFSGLARDV